MDSTPRSSRLPPRHHTLYVRVVVACALVASMIVLVQTFPPLTGRVLAASNPIVTENQLQGSSGWQFDVDSTGTPMKATNHEIEGYASLTSVNQGGQIDLKVNVSAKAQYIMDIYRMGYYPKGTNPDGTPCSGACGGRFMLEVGPLNGTPQPTCPVSTAATTLNMIECQWATAYQLTVPTSWTTGVYVVKLKRLDDNLESYITFVVRADGAPADIVLSEDVTTWEAYNYWGGAGNNDVGYSLYDETNDVTGNAAGTGTARAVSFDRPYIVHGEEDGAGQFFVWDYPMVRYLESQGYDVTYATDIDLENNPNLLSGRKALINTGHDEYYSANMRANLQTYISEGASIGFFSANNIYWRIDFGNSVTGQPDRRIYCPKNSSLNSTLVLWRDQSPPQPENAIEGVMQNGVANNRDFLVSDASSWIYAGTGLVNYSGVKVTSGSGQNAIQGIIGYEFDERAANDPNLSSFVSYEPQGLDQVGHSFVPAADNGTSAYSDAVVYTASSGAIIFAAGTIQWSWGLDNSVSTNFCDCNPGFASPKVRQITANILNRFVSGAGAAPAPAVSLSPSSLSFGNETVSSGTATQTVTVTNSGTAALSITGISIGGTNPSDFSQTNTCPTGSSTVAVGANCVVTVTFAPTTAGPLSATLSVSDNATGSPQSAALTGTGVSLTQPGVSLNPSSLNFGGQSIGSTSAPQTVTLTDNGNGPLTISSIALTGANASEYAETSTCPMSPNTLALGANCTVSITFSPVSSGARTASLTITDDAPDSPQSLSITGDGAVGSTYFIDGFESGNFSQWSGPLGPGTATVQSAVTNTGSYAAALTNTSGQVVYLTTSLAGGAHATTFTRFYFRVTSGASSTTLMKGRDASGNDLWEVDYNAGRSGLDTFFWNGARTRTDIYSNNNVLAANTWYSVEIEANETTSGYAQVWLDGQSIGSASTDLSTSTPYSTILLFSQAIGTAYFDDIEVSDSYNGPIGGVSSAPAVGLTPTSLSFGSENVGATTAAQKLTLNNTGSAALSISSMSFTGANPGDFAETTTCPMSPSTLAAGTSCTISVSFTPTATGTRTATLSIADDASGSPQSAVVTGMAMAAGTYFSEDFESGTLNQWQGPYGNGQASVESTVVNTGTQAAALVNASGQVVDLDAPLIGGAHLATYTRIYFRAASGATSTPIAKGNDTNAHSMWEVDYNASRAGLDVYFWNGAGTRFDLYSSQNAIAADTWYSIDIQDTESTNGVGQVWINGLSIGAVTGDFSTSTGYSSLQLYSQATGTVYYDDIAVTDSYVGPIGSTPAPHLTISPSSLTYSSQPINTTSAPQSVTLTNNGNANLNIASIGFTGVSAAEFAQTNTCGASLSPGFTCTVTLTFTPTAGGTGSADLSVSDNASASPQQVAVSGMGLPTGSYFMEDFESGSFGQWTGPTGTGAATIQTSVVKSGTHAAALTNASGQYVYLTSSLSGGAQTNTYTKFSFQVAHTGSSTMLMKGTDSSGNNRWEIDYDAGRAGIDIFFWNGAGSSWSVYSNTGVIAPGQWYDVEIQDTEATNGTGQVWLNGSSIGAITQDLSTSSGFANLTVFSQDVDTIYLDDIQVANSYIQ